jgi:NTE family protein
LENKCRFLIGSFVNPSGYEERVTTLLQIAVRTFLLSMSKEVNEKASKFDLLIAPPELSTFKILDPEKADDLFEVGYKATKEKLQNIDLKAINS